MKKLFSAAFILTCMIIATSLSAPTPENKQINQPHHLSPLSKDSLILELRLDNNRRLKIIEEKSRKITNDIQNNRSVGEIDQ